MAAPHRARGNSAWDKFVSLPNNDRRELIDGQLTETEVPTELHEHIVAHIVFFFIAWARNHGGAAYASGYRLKIDARRGFFPDAQLYHPSNRAERTRLGCVRGAPDVVLEVLSEGSVKYDKKAKLVGYAQAGVAEYWIASQEEQFIERLVLRREKYVVEQVLVVGDTLKCARFPGLEIPIDELFTVNPPGR